MNDADFLVVQGVDRRDVLVTAVHQAEEPPSELGLDLAELVPVERLHCQ